MSTVRLRYVTRGVRGLTNNKRLSRASRGWLPLNVLGTIWREVISFTVYINRTMREKLER